jgi:leucyl-tRNA synthetase
MELRNAIQRAGEVGHEAWAEAVTTLLKLMAPVTPYMAEELWSRLGQPYSIHRQMWPVYDAALAAEEEATLVVSVNGKVRDRLAVPADISEEDAIARTLASAAVQRHLRGREPHKIIYIAERKMINVVI